MKKLLLLCACALSFVASSARSACIDEQGFVPINGIQQWIAIRGERCDNPVVLFLHGGPGNPMSPYAKAMYGAWEKHFTMVQWDQRGAGMTFGRNPPGEDDALTLELMRDDGLAVAQHVLKRLGKRKLILMGSSWSSILGVYMVKARPELFAAYIGTAHLVRYPDNLQASYARVMELAKAAKDAETVAKLDALGAPPWVNPRNSGVLRRAIRKYEALSTEPAPRAWWTPEPFYATPKALADYEAGDDYSYVQFVGMKGDGMASKVDLYKLGTKFQLPVFIVQGTEDLLTTPDIARRYADAIRAPQKEFVMVPRTGHDPNQPMLDAQFKLLMERARTLAD